VLFNTQQLFKTFKTRRLLSLGAALLTVGAAVAMTAPAHATDSGLGFYDTADIYPDGNWHLDYDTFGTGLKTNAFTSTGIEYGFGKGGDGLFGRNEIGFDYVVSGFANGSVDKRLALNYKAQIYNNDKSGVRLAAGVSGVGDKSNFGAVDTHVLGYKAFKFGRVHAGLWEAFGRAAGVDDTGGLQLGFDKTIGKFVIGGDWRSGPTGNLAPCVIWNFTDKADFELCSGRANGSGKWTTYIGFDYNFDFKKK
jgi:hypothetical protein